MGVWSVEVASVLPSIFFCIYLIQIHLFTSYFGLLFDCSVTSLLTHLIEYSVAGTSSPNYI